MMAIVSVGQFRLEDARMSTDKDLTAEDYYDASRRYRECSLMAVRRRQIGEVAAEFDSFIRSPTGLAALNMLASANKRIEFARTDVAGSNNGDVCVFELDCNMNRIGTIWGSGDVTRESDFDAHSIVETWLGGGRDRYPKDFMLWLKAELKRIHDEAPGKPQGDGASDDDEGDGTAGLEREG